MTLCQGWRNSPTVFRMRANSLFKNVLRHSMEYTTMSILISFKMIYYFVQTIKSILLRLKAMSIPFRIQSSGSSRSDNRCHISSPIRAYVRLFCSQLTVNLMSACQGFHLRLLIGTPQEMLGSFVKLFNESTYWEAQ